MDNPRINISFKNNFEDIKLYVHCKKQRDVSNYIKDLIEKDIERSEG